MRISFEQIRNEIIDCRLEAISLDTSIFDRHSRALERGLLRRLRQFSRGTITLVLSEIVVRELHAHVLEDAKNAEANLRRDIKAIAQAWQTPEDSRLRALALLLGGHTVESIAQQRMDSFRTETRMEGKRPVLAPSLGG